MQPTQKESDTAVVSTPPVETQTATVEYTDNHQPNLVAEVQKSEPQAQSPAHMEDQQKNLEQLKKLRDLLGASPDTYDNIGEAGANKIEVKESDIHKEPLFQQIVDFINSIPEEFYYDVIKRRATPRIRASSDFYKLEKEKATLLHQVPEGEEQHHKPPQPPAEAPTVVAPVPPAFEQAFKEETPEATNPTLPEVPAAFTKAFDEPQPQVQPQETQPEAVPAKPQTPVPSGT